MSHDPERHAEQILQCLMQDKKPIGLLLGAGCPFSILNESGEPLIPDIMGITRVVINEIDSSEFGPQLAGICQIIAEETGSDPTVEDILSYLRSLREYPGAYNAIGVEKTTINELEGRVCKEIRNCVNKKLTNKSTPFHKMATWIGSVNRDFPVEIFTTNYDLLIEQALEDARVPFFDGFVGSRFPFFDAYAIDFDQLPPRWSRVWKIHGSINWRRMGDDQTFHIRRTGLEEGEEVVIHPSHLKYDQSRRMPYLAMMDRLRNFVSTPSSALIIIGYSFRDQHLNDVIIQGLQGSPSSAAFALMYSNLNDYPTVRALAEGRGNLSVMASDGAIIGTKVSDWEVMYENPETKFSVGAVSWVKAEDGESVWKAIFGLGDFNNFAQLLQDLSGRMG